MPGEINGYVMDKLLEIGALDVFFTPIYMKKNRPAVKLSILSKEEDLSKIQELIFKETTTLGIRMYLVDRVCMERNFYQLETELGSIGIKEGLLGDIKKYSPEYEDCKKLAIKHNVPIKDVYDMAISKINSNDIKK